MKAKAVFPIGLLLFVFALAACSAGEPLADVETEVAVTAAVEPTDSRPEPTQTEPPSILPAGTAETPTAGPTLAPGNPLSDELARRFMDDLIGGDGNRAEEAMATILEAGDTRFIAVFVELMRARQIGAVRGDYDAYIDALESLSGQDLGENWPAWIEWYGQTSLLPPAGFTSWKGRIMGRIDPRFADFMRDELPSRIRVEEIQWGGVGVDGIPPLENPPMIAATEADYLLPEEPVFGLEINGDARAYPLRIVDNHEMANDVVGDVPISLAYCTLCGAAIAYDGRAPNGQTYTFGTSGFLYRSNKLMYDRTTRTLWNQLTGRPVLGELAADETLQLNILPIVLSSWQNWREQHPDTLVLDRETGVYPAEFYEPGILYGGYFASEDTMFPVWQRSDLLPDKEFVYALYLDGAPKAYHVASLAEEQVVNDLVGETAVVLVATQGTVTVEGDDRRQGAVTYTNGGEVRAYDRGEMLFVPGPEPYTILDEAGQEWRVTEAGLIGPDGQVAERLNGHLAYWFGWYTFFPDTLLYVGDEIEQNP